MSEQEKAVPLTRREAAVYIRERYRLERYDWPRDAAGSLRDTDEDIAAIIWRVTERLEERVKELETENKRLKQELAKERGYHNPAAHLVTEAKGALGKVGANGEEVEK